MKLVRSVSNDHKKFHQILAMHMSAIIGMVMTPTNVFCFISSRKNIINFQINQFILIKRFRISQLHTFVCQIINSKEIELLL